MTNEELVTKIQAGERDRLPELWEQVERFVANRAQRLMTLYANGYMTNTGGVEFDDLYNSGYIALVAAVDTYKPDSEMQFIGWFAFALQTAFGNTGGWRAHKNDALRRAVSLDAPPSEDGGEDDRALAELVEDPSAAQGLQGVEDSIFLDQLHAALERALQRLPEAEGDAIRGKYFEGRKLSRDEKNAEHRGMSKLINPALHAELLQYIEDRTPYYLRVGIQTQRNTGESAVEKIVFKREALRRKVGLE